MAWLHTWVGLLSGWVLFFVFMTGSAAYFKDEITRWMQPDLPLRELIDIPPTLKMAQQAVHYFSQHARSDNRAIIVFPNNGGRSGALFRGYASDTWLKIHGDLDVHLDPITGNEALQEERTRTEGGQIFKDAHWKLHYLGEKFGVYIVGVAAILGLVAVVGGLIVHKKIFADFFTFRPGKGQRSWLDGHNVISVIGLPFFFMIIYTGLVEKQHVYVQAPKIFSAKEEVQGKEKEAEKPIPYSAIPIMPIISHAEMILGVGEIGQLTLNDLRADPAQNALKQRVVTVRRAWGTQYPFASRDNALQYDARTGQFVGGDEFGQAPDHKSLWWLVSAHRAWFAGAGLRWLLFVSGLFGCAMIATGLVLWSVKRHEKHARRGVAHVGLRLVDWLNVGTIIGLPIGIAAYFWANRLLPVSLSERADWEVRCLFLAWGWMLLYAAFRPAKRIWSEMLWLATAAFGLIPVLNALTTDKHLGITIFAGDWVLAGLDLTMLALALLFGFAALKLRRKQSASSPPYISRQVVTYGGTSG